MDDVTTTRSWSGSSYFHTGAAPTEEFRSDGEPISPVHARREALLPGRHLLSHRIAWLPFGGMMEARLDGRSADLALEAPSFPRHRVTQRGRVGRCVRTAARARPGRQGDPSGGEVPQGSAGAVPLRSAALPPQVRQRVGVDDRLHDAGDNGEAMFKHLRANQPDINAWSSSKRLTAWERLAREGFEDRMVAHGTVGCGGC